MYSSIPVRLSFLNGFAGCVILRRALAFVTFSQLVLHVRATAHGDDNGEGLVDALELL